MKTMFIKYCDSPSDSPRGIRLVIDGAHCELFYHEKKQSGDEVLDGGLVNSLDKIEQTLKQAFPAILTRDGTSQGELFFTDFVNQFMHFSVRERKKYIRGRK